jgi:signal transduction histidine kinase
VLQEALTNIHRHSQSPSAEIQVTIDEIEVTLEVRDVGRGIPSDLLDQFQYSGAETGVGLSGMRERVNECGGHLEIHSHNRNTSVRVSIPLMRRGA